MSKKKYDASEQLRWSNLLHSFLHVFHCVGGDQGMQRLIFPWQHLSILSANLPLLHRTFTPNHDLGAAFLLDVLQCITTVKSKGETLRTPHSISHFKLLTYLWKYAKHATQLIFNPIYRGPISRPTKLISGYSSWGIITLSLTLVAGGLQEANTRKAFTRSNKQLSDALKNSCRHIIIIISPYRYLYQHPLAPFSARSTSNLEISIIKT